MKMIFSMPIFFSGEFALFYAYPIFDSVRPINPNTAFVGGMHLHDPKPLPADLKKWADDAKDGFIYISFGSVSAI
jgi:glucuronosyltransferase